MLLLVLIDCDALSGDKHCGNNWQKGRGMSPYKRRVRTASKGESRNRRWGPECRGRERTQIAPFEGWSDTVSSRDIFEWPVLQQRPERSTNTLWRGLNCWPLLRRKPILPVPIWRQSTRGRTLSSGGRREGTSIGATFVSEREILCPSFQRGVKCSTTKGHQRSAGFHNKNEGKLGNFENRTW